MPASPRALRQEHSVVRNASRTIHHSDCCVEASPASRDMRDDRGGGGGAGTGRLLH